MHNKLERRYGLQHPNRGAGVLGLDVVPRTLCELRKALLPPNLKAVRCSGYVYQSTFPDGLKGNP